MGKFVIKHFEQDSISDGGTWESEWVADENYTIKYILVNRKDGQPFTASTITMHIEDQPLTKDKAPVKIFGNDMLNAMPINESLDKDKKFSFSLKNEEGTTISVMLDLVLEKA